MSSNEVVVSPVPPTEPKQRKAPQKVTVEPRITGASLSADPSKHKGGVEKSFLYWVGALPGCPVESVTLGGLCFPKMEELVSRGVNGETVRNAVLGSIVRMTEDNLRRIVERLPRTVIRFRPSSDGPKDAVGHHGAGLGIESVSGDQRRRKGQLITIPTDAETKARRDAGRNTNLYRPGPSDEPAARYLFAVLCDQKQPGRGDHYPEPLEVTGLDWPSET